MGIYGFKPQFEPLILNGTKFHTIRARRKYEDVPGNTMHLYVGLRTSFARLVARVPCIRVGSVLIPEPRVIRIDNARLDSEARQRLAESDGFESWEQMVEFFRGRLPFEGKIYHWTPLRREK